MRRSIAQGAVVALALQTAIWLTGCYSFTGASVPPHLKTVAIPLVDDQSGFGEPGLRETFTTALTALFTSDNSLRVTERSNADAVIECVLMPISDAPAIVAAGETVRKRRITMTVKATFTDMKLRRKIYEKNFSNWGDYDSGGGSSQRAVGIQDATKKITEDILLETVSGW